MKIYTPKEELLKLLDGEKISKFPRSIPISTPVVEMMKNSGVYWPEAHKNAKLMAKLAIVSNEMGNFNVVNVPFDMTVEAEALGSKTIWSNKKEDIPQVKGIIFNNSDDINFGKNILKKGRFPVVLEAVELLKEKYNNNIPIIPFIDGPFTIASLTMGVNNMFKIMIKNEKKAKKILDIFSDLCILYGNEQLTRGADLIMMLSPNVSGLGGKQFEDIIIPVYKKIAEEIKGKVILHICGHINRIIKFIPQSDFTSFSFDYPATEIELVKKFVGVKMKIIGSIPTIDCLLEGTKEDVFKQSIHCIKKGIDILSPSCCIPPEVKIENLREMAKAIDYWNEYMEG